MDPDYKLKLLKKTLLELKNGLLLVEGKNDLKALHELGIGGNVLTATGRNEQIVRKAISSLEPGQKLVLLFDYDEEGERKARYFGDMFLHEGVSANTVIRRKLRMLLGINTIEDLPTAYFDVISRS